jgi:hypothetical protein
VSSMASVANLAFTLAGSPISADFILASVRAPAGAAPRRARSSAAWPWQACR